MFKTLIQDIASPIMDRRGSLFREEEEDEAEEKFNKKEDLKDFQAASSTEPALLRIRNYSDNVQGTGSVIVME